MTTAVATKTIAELLEAGRPPVSPGKAAETGGFSLTHTVRPVGMDERGDMLPLGVVYRPNDANPDTKPEVIRSFKWRRYSGAVQLAVGGVRGDYMDEPGEAFPRIIAACLDKFGPLDARKDEEEVLRLIGMCSYSDLIYLLLSRAFYILKKVPVHPGMECEQCGKPLSETLKPTTANLTVGVMDWQADRPPLAVSWLDDPFEYGEDTVGALVLCGISWRNLYGRATTAALRNRRWSTIRAVSESVVGYVTTDGAYRESPIPSREIEDRMCGVADYERASRAVYGCTGGAVLWGHVKHGCGATLRVPFDWLGAAQI